jgi:hypothetical protein
MLGLALHFAILQIAAVVYFVAAQPLQLLRQRYVVCGLVFAIQAAGFRCAKNG